MASVDAFRKKYGHGIADTVEHYAHMLAHRRNGPKAQDIKATLRAIVQSPSDADLAGLDSDTRAFIEDEAWRRYRIRRIRELAPADLVACAQAILQRPPQRGGRKKTDDIAMQIVRDLSAVSRGGAKRNQLIEDALCACGLGSGTKNLQRVTRKAGR